MTADLLRRAAAKAREVAEAATEVWGAKKWEAFDAAEGAYVNGTRMTRDLDRHHVATADEHGSILLTSPWDETQITRHAALWDPDVAFAVADLLDAVAANYEIAKHGYWSIRALAIARLILGADS